MQMYAIRFPEFQNSGLMLVKLEDGNFNFTATTVKSPDTRYEHRVLNPNCVEVNEFHKDIKSARIIFEFNNSKTSNSGIYIHLFNNPLVWTSFKFKNGKRNGIYVDMSADGSKTVTNFKNNEVNSAVICYSKEENMKCILNTKNLKLDGDVVYFNSDGSFNRVDTFKDGKIIRTLGATRITSDKSIDLTKPTTNSFDLNDENMII